MGRFVSGTKVVRADWWDEGEEVVIRKLDYGRRKAIQRASTRIVPGADGGREIVYDLVGMDEEILVQGVVSWTFGEDDGRPTTDDGEGQRVRVNRASLKRLDERDAEYILSEINAYNPRRSKEEQASFRGEAGDGAAGGEGASGGAG